MIFRNAMQTPDGTIIESKFRHDYVTHDDKNGDTYMVDGGHDYLRRSVNEIPARDLSEASIDDDHEHNRQHLKWGTYGKNGKQPLTWITLKDMYLEHINAILNGKQTINQEMRDFFEKEIEYREENQ